MLEKRPLEKEQRMDLKEATFKQYCVEDKKNHGLCAGRPLIVPLGI